MNVRGGARPGSPQAVVGRWSQSSRRAWLSGSLVVGGTALAAVASGWPLDFGVIGFGLLMVGVIAILQIVSVCWRARWWLLVHEHDGRVCPHCGHGLSGLADKAQCPECGRWHDVERLRAEWFAALKLDVPSRPNERRSDPPRGGGGDP